MTDRQPSIMELFDRIELPESNNELEDFPEEEILPENVNTTDQKELINAYTAGFFDGEGCIGTDENNRNIPPSIHLNIKISLTDLPTLTKLKQEFGGEIHIRKKPKGKEHWKQAWNWNITDRTTLKKFLTRIFPYSIYKKPQIEDGLRFLELIKNSQSGKTVSQEEYKLRRLISDKLHELKHTELSSCELNNFNTQIQEMNIDKNQRTMMDF